VKPRDHPNRLSSYVRRWAFADRDEDVRGFLYDVASGRRRAAVSSSAPGRG
jgi:hypothetical protein